MPWTPENVSSAAASQAEHTNSLAGASECLAYRYVAMKEFGRNAKQFVLAGSLAISQG